VQQLCTTLKGHTMARRSALILVCCVLTLSSVACAPPLVGPTAGAGYVFSLQVSDPVIWLGLVDASVAWQFPQVSEVIVRVQDAQGRPVDDVPVTFAVEAEWANSITITPAHTRTHGGSARALVSEPQTTGVVRIMARVDDTTAQARLTVQTYQRKSSD
jgi:hypothetical protein